MSINSNEIKNYNLSQKLFLDVIKEFEGYLLGLSKGDILTFTDSIARSKVEEIKRDIADNKDASLEAIKREIVPNIFDRSIGRYFTRDILNNKSLGINTGFIPSNIGDYINIVYGDQDFNVKDNSPASFVNTMIKSKEDGEPKPLLASQALIIAKVADYVSEQVGDDIYENPNSDNPVPKMYISGIVKGLDENNKVILEEPEVNKNKRPDRFDSPHLVSTVIKHPSISITNKNSNHLPIFFNGVPPIEMSRCTPYLDVRIISKKFNNSPGISNVNHLRFIKSKAGNKFVLDDNIGFNDYKPRTSDENIESGNFNFSFMDVFASPQTLSNANINSPSRGVTSLFAGSNNDNPILEPISPLMTLKSVGISISGKGYGLMASKNASLSLTLHDRSRLAEIAPLVASNQLAGTKIYIEYGWNHPEGGVNSDNVIGKYLNSLKDGGFYQVYSSNYKFGKSGVVDIDLKLAASGFRETETVHVGAGPVVPGNVLEDLVEQAVNEILEEDNKRNSIKEVRKKLKTNSRNARDIYTHFTWAEYRDMASALNKSSGDYAADNLILKNKLKSFIATVSGAETATENFSASDLASLNNLNLINANKFEKRSTMIQNVYAKLDYLGCSSLIDPYLLCFVEGSKESKDSFVLQEEKSYEEQKKYYMDSLLNMNTITGRNSEEIGNHISLGSLFMAFVGYPLAATCLYDEVNVVFHPFNHQSGGARKYTTANFPIPIEKVKEVIQDAIKKNSSLNINTFINLIERKILKNRDLFGYGLSNLYKDYNNLDAKSDDEKIAMISNIVAEGSSNEKLGINEKSDVDKQFIEIAGKISGLQEGIESSEFGTLTSESVGGGTYKTKALSIFNNHKIDLKSKIRESISGQVSKLYAADELNSIYPPTDKFVLPNIAIDFEVSPAIDVENANASQNLTYFQKFLKVSKNKIDNNNEGIFFDKSILTLHIYDQESVLSPYENALLTTKTEGIEDVPTDINFYEKVKNLSFPEVKQIIKRAYPSINYGAMSATINSVEFSANTSGKLANVLIVDSFQNVQNAPSKGYSYETPYESTTLFPARVTVNCMGIPMIGRGNNIFIDFGTNTTLDNVYTVSSVNHDLSSGNFKTKVELLPVQMGSVSSFRDKVAKLYKKTE